MSGKVSRRSFLKLTANIGGAAVLTAVAGCTPQAPTTTKAGEKPASNPPPAQAIELRFIKLSMVDSVSKYFNETAIKNFQDANPGVTVKVDMSDWEHLGEKLLTSSAGNLPLDLIETGSDWVGPYAKRKQFLSIENYVKLYPEIDQFYKEMVDISRYKGNLMALPFILDVRTVCYRKDHYQEVGLDPEKAPDTWDDQVNYALKLTKRDDQGNITRAGWMLNATNPNDAFFEFWYLLMQNGGDVITPWDSWDPSNLSINSPEAVEALQFLYDLINKHKVSPITGMSAKTPDLSALAEGVTSNTVQGSWEIGTWKRNQPDKLKLLGIGVPLMNKKRVQYACPNVYAIGTNTKYPDKAFELMKFMLTKDTMVGMLGPESNLPPRKDVVAEAEYMKDPLLQKFTAVVEKGWGRTTPQAVDFPMLEICGNYIQAVLRGEMKVVDALNTSSEEIKKKMADLQQ